MCEERRRRGEEERRRRKERMEVDVSVSEPQSLKSPGLTASESQGLPLRALRHQAAPDVDPALPPGELVLYTLCIMIGFLILESLSSVHQTASDEAGCCFPASQPGYFRREGRTGGILIRRLTY